MGETRQLVVVYQFGKVASTALVNALGRAPGVEAHQCHFLGEDALCRMVTHMTDGGVSPYFRRHMIGQFNANLDLTHRINRIRCGAEPAELKVVTLVRDPVDWLRSGIQQDIEGYRDDILAAATRISPDASIEIGLTDVLEKVAGIIEEKGGMDAVLTQLAAGGGPRFFLSCDAARDLFVRRIFLLTLRPLMWFDDHFARCFGFGLDAFAPDRGHWKTRRDGTDFVIMRYEDLGTALAPAMEAVGIPFDGELRRANVSSSKPFAEDIRTVFAGNAARALSRLTCDSDYARRFGYADAQRAGAVPAKEIPA